MSNCSILQNEVTDILRRPNYFSDFSHTPFQWQTCKFYSPLTAPCSDTRCVLHCDKPLALEIVLPSLALSHIVIPSLCLSLALLHALCCWATLWQVLTPCMFYWFKQVIAKMPQTNFEDRYVAAWRKTRGRGMAGWVGGCASSIPLPLGLIQQNTSARNVRHAHCSFFHSVFVWLTLQRHIPHSFFLQLPLSVILTCTKLV